MVQNLYGECMALEELLEESVNTLGPDARDILAQIRFAPNQGCFLKYMFGPLPFPSVAILFTAPKKTCQIDRQVMTDARCLLWLVDI